MLSKGRDVIVIGTAAGGLEALDQLIGQLRADLPASIVIVQHMDPGNSGEPLLRRLGRHQAFHPKLAEDGERLRKLPRSVDSLKVDCSAHQERSCESRSSVKVRSSAS